LKRPRPDNSRSRDTKLDSQARARGHRNQGVEVELIELSLQQGVESQLRDPQALGRGGSRESTSLHNALDVDHQLGAKRECVRLAFWESEVAKHIHASAPHSHWIIHSFRRRRLRVSG